MTATLRIELSEEEVATIKAAARAEVLAGLRTEVGSPYFSPAEAAAFLRLSVRQIRVMTAAGVLTKLTALGEREPRYLRSEVEALMATSAIRARKKPAMKLLAAAA